MLVEMILYIQNNIIFINYRLNDVTFLFDYETLTRMPIRKMILCFIFISNFY
jgi:hypothetical protein